MLCRRVRARERHLACVSRALQICEGRVARRPSCGGGGQGARAHCGSSRARQVEQRDPGAALGRGSVGEAPARRHRENTHRRPPPVPSRKAERVGCGRITSYRTPGVLAVVEDAGAPPRHSGRALFCCATVLRCPDSPVKDRAGMEAALMRMPREPPAARRFFPANGSVHAGPGSPPGCLAEASQLALEIAGGAAARCRG